MVTELLWVRNNEGFKRMNGERNKENTRTVCFVFFNRVYCCYIFLHNKQMDKPSTKLFSSLTGNYIKIALILVFSLCVCVCVLTSAFYDNVEKCHRSVARCGHWK